MTDAQNREVLEYDGSTGALLRWYAYGLGPNAVLGQMNVPAGTRTTPVPDLLGSIVASMDAGTGALTKFAYRPYGASATPATPFGFTGQRFDAESGLYYYRARMYSPAWGRFIQTDPIGYEGGINLYGYVGADPLNANDPEGLLAEAISGFLDSLYRNSLLKPVEDIGLLASRFQDDPLGTLSSVLNSFPQTRLEGGLTTLAVTAFGMRSASPELALLAKSLASESQVADISSGRFTAIAGAGSREVLRDEPRLLAQYGGSPGTWQKITSGAYNASDGVTFQTHAYRNSITGQIVELKSTGQPLVPTR